MLVKPSQIWSNLVKLGQTCYKLVLFGVSHYILLNFPKVIFYFPKSKIKIFFSKSTFFQPDFDNFKNIVYFIFPIKWNNMKLTHILNKWVLVKDLQKVLGLRPALGVVRPKPILKGLGCGLDFRPGLVQWAGPIHGLLGPPRGPPKSPTPPLR